MHHNTESELASWYICAINMYLQLYKISFT